jgi:Uma2 family endonuclease
VLSADTGFVLSHNPDTVRAPDVSFLRRDRLPEGEIPTSFFPGAPDLAIEVLSPSDSIREATAKALEYLAAGTREVCIVSPERKDVTVHRGGEVFVRSEDESLDGGDLLPGFSSSVAELFII